MLSEAQAGAKPASSLEAFELLEEECSGHRSSCHEDCDKCLITTKLGGGGVELRIRGECGGSRLPEI